MARVAATTDHSIEVEWDPPADNGGGEILGYHVDKVRSQRAQQAEAVGSNHMFWFCLSGIL